MLSSHGTKLELTAVGFAIINYFDYLIEDDYTIALTKDFASNAVRMYPNPAKEVVSFSFASNIALEVTIYLRKKCFVQKTYNLNFIFLA